MTKDPVASKNLTGGEKNNNSKGCIIGRTDDGGKIVNPIKVSGPKSQKRSKGKTDNNNSWKTILRNNTRENLNKNLNGAKQNDIIGVNEEGATIRQATGTPDSFLGFSLPMNDLVDVIPFSYASFSPNSYMDISGNAVEVNNTDNIKNPTKTPRKESPRTIDGFNELLSYNNIDNPSNIAPEQNHNEQEQENSTPIFDYYNYNPIVQSQDYGIFPSGIGDNVYSMPPPTKRGMEFESTTIDPVDRNTSQGELLPNYLNSSVGSNILSINSEFDINGAINNLGSGRENRTQRGLFNSMYYFP